MKKSIQKKPLFVLLIYLLSIYACSFRLDYTSEELVFASDWILYKVKGNLIDLEYFAAGAPSISFDPGGNIKIFTGCNFINGKFTINGDKLNIDFASSSDMCPDIFANDFMNSLKDSKKYVIEKEKLMLMDDSTVLLAFFPK